MSRPSKNGGPFQALQNMHVFDPMTGKPLPTANPVLLKIALRKNRCNELLKAIINLPLITIDSEPEWKNCINVSGPDLDQEMAFNILAQKLETKLNIMPLALRTMNKDGITIYWVKTGN